MPRRQLFLACFSAFRQRKNAIVFYLIRDVDRSVFEIFTVNFYYHAMQQYLQQKFTKKSIECANGGCWLLLLLLVMTTTTATTATMMMMLMVKVVGRSLLNYVYYVLKCDFCMVHTAQSRWKSVNTMHLSAMHFGSLNGF